MKSEEIKYIVQHLTEKYTGTECSFSDLDSLDKSCLIADIEEKFDIAINDSEISKLNNLQKLQNYVIKVLNDDN